MGLLSALFKTVATAASDAMYNADKEKCNKRAYGKVGTDIESAKKSGKYINARADYQYRKKQEQQKADQRQKHREIFINNL